MVILRALPTPTQLALLFFGKCPTGALPEFPPSSWTEGPPPLSPETEASLPRALGPSPVLLQRRHWANPLL